MTSNRRWIAVVLLFAGLALTTSATAQTDIERARSQFQQGTQAYQNGEYEEAIGFFQEANSIAPNPRLLLYIGQCYEVLGDATEALQYVEDYAASSAEAAGEVAGLMEELRTRVNSIFASAQYAVGSALDLACRTYCDQGDGPIRTDLSVAPLFVDSEPAGAEVYLDTTSLGPIGRTPLRTSVFVGAHVVIVELDHHRGFREVVDVTTPEHGAVTSVYAHLERGVAAVDLTVRPISARLTYISPTGNNRDLGQGGWQGELPAGPAVFILQHAGEDRRIEMTLEAGDSAQEHTLYLDPSLETRTEPDQLGTLVVRNNLALATVTVDGATIGSGLGEFTTELTPGLHTIRVCQDGYVCAIDNVRIGSGERQTWLAPVRLEEISSTPWGGIVATGLGVAAAGVATFFVLDAASKRDEDKDDEADTSAIIGYATYGVAGALIITGIVLFVNSGPDGDASAGVESPVWVGAAPNDGGWGFTLGGRF